nr:penicillin acylase family protein [Xanthomonas sp.]
MALLLAASGLGLALALWLALRGSVAALDGQVALDGLSAPVGVQRDALGTVTIDAANETDAMRALGFVHAQERYFEMDLMRRSAAGELSELVGAAALDLDRQRRVHRLRARVDAHLGAFAGRHAAQLQAYSDGANRGLHALRVRPWPYLLLRQAPRDWQPTDSALAGYAMYFDLQDSQDTRELALARLQSALPPALFALLRSDGTPWDAPISGQARADAALPDATQVDLRTLPGADRPVAHPPELGAPGSNNWAVSGRRTADGRAIVANDMHLKLRAPSLWFRVRLRYADAAAPGGRVDIAGFSLPGLPAIVVGSNGHVAWGFTNSYADTADWYRLTPCAAAPADGCTAVRRHRERLRVAGAAPVEFEVEDTDYGPILHHEADGSALALRWVAQQPGALNLGLADFARAGSLDAAFASAQAAATPAQNLMLADAGGRIGWRVLGPLPLRGPGCAVDALVHDVRAGIAPPGGRCAPWPISTRHSPQRIDPDDGQLWTANARVVDGDELAVLGDGGYALGARARQIRDDLRLHPHLDERQLLAIQLDDRAVFLQRWWALLERQRDNARTPALQALAQAAKHWEGRASTDSVSYRVVRAWRLAVLSRIAEGLTAPAQAVLGDAFIAPKLPQLEGVAWPLLQQRPPHLLPRRYASWQALLEDAAVEVRDELAQAGPLPQRAWGEQNTAAICHPLAGALPAPARRWLCMPAEPLPGDNDMPRVQRPDFGASERIVVAPGHEADGIVHMPGGQSGHPLSPFWGAGHADWVQGRASPFLPGPARYTLTLRPPARQ